MSFGPHSDTLVGCGNSANPAKERKHIWQLGRALQTWSTDRIRLREAGELRSHSKQEQ